MPVTAFKADYGAEPALARQAGPMSGMPAPDEIVSGRLRGRRIQEDSSYGRDNR